MRSVLCDNGCTFVEVLLVSTCLERHGRNTCDAVWVNSGSIIERHVALPDSERRDGIAAIAVILSQVNQPKMYPDVRASVDLQYAAFDTIMSSRIRR